MPEEVTVLIVLREGTSQTAGVVAKKRDFGTLAAVEEDFREGLPIPQGRLGQRPYLEDWNSSPASWEMSVVWVP